VRRTKIVRINCIVTKVFRMPSRPDRNTFSLLFLRDFALRCAQSRNATKDVCLYRNMMWLFSTSVPTPECRDLAPLSKPCALSFSHLASTSEMLWLSFIRAASTDTDDARNIRKIEKRNGMNTCVLMNRKTALEIKNEMAKPKNPNINSPVLNEGT